MSEFLRVTRLMRHCWINGRYGGGKTTLALALASEMVRIGASRYVALNMPLNVDAPFVVTRNQADVTEARDCCIIMDEAGQFLDVASSPAKFRSWFLALAKRNQCVLMPSVLPVHRLAQRMRCQRIFNGLQLGLPVWVYRWRYKLDETSDTGLYWWWQPDRIFGLYDRDYEPDDRWWVYDFQTEDQWDAIAEVGVGIETGVS